MSDKHESGKGDRYRPVNSKKWKEGWQKAFGINKTIKPKIAKGENSNASKKEK